MPTVTVLYPTPTDVATFDRRYQDEHMALVQQHLGMARFRALRVVGTPSGPAPYHKIVQLTFDTPEAMQAALASAGAQATVAHAVEISSGGAPVFLICEEA